MKRNAELLRTIADKIEAEPECYDQTIYPNMGEKGGISHWAHKFTDQFDMRLASQKLGIKGGQLWSPRWRPVPGLTVPEALRKLADGASVASVSA